MLIPLCSQGKGLTRFHQAARKEAADALRQHNKVRHPQLRLRR